MTNDNHLFYGYESESNEHAMQKYIERLEQYIKRYYLSRENKK